MAALWLCLSATAAGQYVPLHRGARGSWYLNLDRLWNYNLYEQSRWGAGLRYGSVRWNVEGYAGYGVLDRQLKGGVSGALHLGGSTLYAGAARDYQAAGSRRLSVPSLRDPASLGSFMSRRMSDRMMLTTGFRHRHRGYLWLAEGNVQHGGRLFHNRGLLYRVAGDTIEPETLLEARLAAEMPWGLTTQLQAGVNLPKRQPVVRWMVQYDREWTLSPFAVQLFLQGGATLRETPYVRMFDLGGTFGAPFCFRQSLLTARPNEFTAHVFTFLSLRVGWSRPLMEGWNPPFQIGTSPRPFVGLNAAWGHLWGQDPEGGLAWEGLELQSPLYGIVEPMAGVEGLLRWGAVDWGAAVAWRWVPKGAPYRYADTQDNLALMVTARLTF